MRYRIALLVSVLASLLALGGCAAPAPVNSGPEESFLMLVADWDDVEPAAIVAASRAELAIVGTRAGDQEITFQLRTLEGEPGTLRAVRRSLAASGPIHLSANIGLFRELESERRLLQAMAKRLRQLAGVDYAPL
jgi:hypothetical protein